MAEAQQFTPQPTENVKHARARRSNLTGYVIILCMGILCMLVAYSAYWLWYANVVKTNIAENYEELKANNIELSTLPKVGGYPFLHKVTFAGTISTPTTLYTVPSLRVSGISLPWQEVQLNFQKGLSWQERHVGGATYVLDKLELGLSLPDTWPGRLSQEELANWREDNNTLEVQHFFLEKTPLILNARGQFYLSDELQPSGKIEFVSRGHDRLIKALSEEGFLEPQDNLFIQGAFSGFSRIDEKTGDKILNLSLEIKDSFLFLGPLRVAPMPRLTWPTDAELSNQ